MSELMKCFVMHGIGKVGVMDKPVPRAGPNDAIIRTTAALICTSDTHTVAGAIGDRQGLTLGHEAVGVIHELGELAAASGLFHVGQRVAVSAITPCYACDNCQRGYPSQCGGMLGGWKFANLKDGRFDEHFHVNNAVANLAPIPDGLSDEQAAYCCDVIVDFTKDDPVEAILKLTGGNGVDSAIEALGSSQTFAACVRVTRPGGTISNIGYHGDGDSVPIPREAWGVGMSDKTIRTALCPGGSERMSRLLRLIETSRVDPLALTTHRFPFQDIEKAFRMMQTKEDGMIKQLIMFV